MGEHCNYKTIQCIFTILLIYELASAYATLFPLYREASYLQPESGSGIENEKLGVSILAETSATYKCIVVLQICDFSGSGQHRSSINSDRLQMDKFDVSSSMHDDDMSAANRQPSVRRAANNNGPQYVKRSKISSACVSAVEQHSDNAVDCTMGKDDGAQDDSDEEACVTYTIEVVDLLKALINVMDN